MRERKKEFNPVFRPVPIFAWFAWFAVAVIRNSEGEVRWMEVRDWLKRASDKGRKPVKPIVFAGERFDVMSVRRWRERVLSRKAAG